MPDAKVSFFHSMRQAPRRDRKRKRAAQRRPQTGGSVFQQADGLGGYALPAAGKAQALLGGGLYADLGGGNPQAFARFSRIWGMKGASLGRWASTVASMLQMEKPRSPSSAHTWERSPRLSAPL